jgi:hypothetical protein
MLCAAWLRTGLLFASNVTKLIVVLLVWFAPVTATVAGADVLAPNNTSPPYVATTDAVPGGNRFVLMFATPPVSVNGPIDPSIVVPSLAKAFNATLSVPAAPLGVGVTVALAVNVVPEGVPPLAFVSVVVDGVRVIELHRFSRFATLIDPSPVARSYPCTAWNAGLPCSVLEPEVVTPYAAFPATVQFELPATHATALFPVVMS